MPMTFDFFRERYCLFFFNTQSQNAGFAFLLYRFYSA